VRTTFHSRETAGKMESDARKELSSRVARETDGAARAGNAYTKGNAEFLKGAGGEQQQIRREQDVVLDKMSSSLDTLKEMGQAIDAELKDQEKMCAGARARRAAAAIPTRSRRPPFPRAPPARIDDVDKNIDETQTKMDGALKSIEKMLKTKDRCQLCTIFALVVIFVIGAQ